MANLTLLGFGNVGKAFFLEYLNRGLDSRITLKAIFSSSGGVIIDSKNSMMELVQLVNNDKRLSAHSRFQPINFTEYCTQEPEGIAVFVIPPSYNTGEPNISLYKAALKCGYHIVTADKTGLALQYDELFRIAAKDGLKIKYSATVSAGTPVINVALALKHRDVKHVRGILNATSNYVLNQVEKGKGWDEAVAFAVAEKLAEPNPSIDIDGYDAAAKLAILLNAMGVSAKLNDIQRVSLRVYNESEIRKAMREGFRVKQIAGYDRDENKKFVKPVFVPSISPLAFTEGNYNTVEFSLENESIIIHGPAGPAWRTAKVLISDLIELIDEVYNRTK